MNEKMEALFSNEEFIAKAMELETAEEVQALLAENEVELSIEEIEQLRVAIASKLDGELDEDDLENVAGGVATEIVIGVAGLVIGVVAAVPSFIDLGSRIFRRRW